MTYKEHYAEHCLPNWNSTSTNLLEKIKLDNRKIYGILCHMTKPLEANRGFRQIDRLSDCP